MTLDNPTPEEVRALRLSASLTQEQSALLIHVTGRAWRMYEGGDRKMPAAAWELYRLKVATLKSKAKK